MTDKDTLRDKLLEQLKEWDELIRQGQSVEVLKLCRRLNHKQIPRDLLLDYAQIARRVGAPELILFWYSPIVRSEKEFDQHATAQEKAIYALGLFRLGAFQEAKEILSEIDPAQDPQVNFYFASLYINQWLYAKAIPKLKAYIKDPRVPLYPKMVGRLNLCTCLQSVGKFKAAETEIRRLMKILSRHKLSLLQGNLYEIRAQLHIEMKLWDDARVDLELAAQHLKYADSRSQIYVDKWKNTIALSSSTNKESALLELEAIKARALVAQDWESVRDCDFRRATSTENQILLLHVYWGTLFPGYKDRVLEVLNAGRNQAKEFVWHSDPSQPDHQPVDLVQEAPTETIRRLLFCLTRETYRPLRLTELFDQIYESEFFHAKSSPAKLRQLIARTRQWIEEKNYPIEIIAIRNSYQLRFTAPMSLLLRDSLQASKADLVSIPQPVKEKDQFTAADWASAQNVSSRTARRQILELVRCGKIKSFIRGPKTFYKKVA